MAPLKHSHEGGLDSRTRALRPKTLRFYGSDTLSIARRKRDGGTISSA